MKRLKKSKKPKTISPKLLLRRLAKQARIAWAHAVKRKAGFRCIVCGLTPETLGKSKLNSHHIESFMMCSALRYEIRNGVCACAKCHKFGKDSFHRSFVFPFKILTEQRYDDILWLLEHRNDKVEFTVSYFEEKIKELNSI